MILRRVAVDEYEGEVEEAKVDFHIGRLDEEEPGWVLLQWPLKAPQGAEPTSITQHDTFQEALDDMLPLPRSQ